MIPLFHDCVAEIITTNELAVRVPSPPKQVGMLSGRVGTARQQSDQGGTECLLTYDLVSRT